MEFKLNKQYLTVQFVNVWQKYIKSNSKAGSRNSPPFALLIDILAKNKLFATIADIVHPANPFHLVGCVEFFCDILDLCRAFYELFKAVLRIGIKLFQIRLQGSFEPQAHSAKSIHTASMIEITFFIFFTSSFLYPFPCDG